MSSVYISENCLAVTCCECSQFFPLYWSQSQWAGWVQTPSDWVSQGCWDGGQEGSQGGTICQKVTSPRAGWGLCTLSLRNSTALWREMDGRTPGLVGSIPVFSSRGHGCSWEPMACSVNWWQSVLKHQIYTEHLAMCCSSHLNLFNLLKQGTFFKCDQDIILRGKNAPCP